MKSESTRPSCLYLHSRAISEQVNRLSPAPAVLPVIRRRRITRPENVEIRLRIVRARNPRLRAAMLRASRLDHVSSPASPFSSAPYSASIADRPFPDRTIARSPGASMSLPVPARTWLPITTGAGVEKYCCRPGRRFPCASALYRSSHPATPDSRPASPCTDSCSTCRARDFRCACCPCVFQK